MASDRTVRGIDSRLVSIRGVCFGRRLQVAPAKCDTARRSATRRINVALNLQTVSARKTVQVQGDLRHRAQKHARCGEMIFADHCEEFSGASAAYGSISVS